jgi:sulfite exporter TauE/SafE
MDWLLLFAGGLLGSSHCIGMCGGFALALGSTRRSFVANLSRQAVYSLGRIFTYATAGAAAGFGGWRLMHALNSVMWIQAVLAISAGVLLISEGLRAMGWSAGRSPMSPGSCLGPHFFGALLAASRLRSVFLAGIINGLLPCGLVYAYLALAASSGDMMHGWATMAVFGLGTMPVMVLVGSGGSVLKHTARRHLLRIAGGCVLVMGVISIFRGLEFLPGYGSSEMPVCPFCP